MSSDEEQTAESAPSPPRSRTRRRRRPPPRATRRGSQTWPHLVLAVTLLVGLVCFWSQLATGAAACFSALAPPPPAATEAEPPGAQPSHRQIQIKRVKKSP